MIAKFLSTLLVLFVSAGQVQAGLMDFSVDGNLSYTNDVPIYQFTLDDDLDEVRFWTDSYQDGINFDPYIVLWDGLGNLIDINDDNDLVNPGTQTEYDAGIMLSHLTAGDYQISISLSGNFEVGNTLSQGFFYDNDTPIPLSHIGMGDYWRIWFDGQEAVAVPEPNVMLLMLLGLSGMLIRRKI